MTGDPTAFAHNPNLADDPPNQTGRREQCKSKPPFSANSTNP
jgi:hypothetical protein